MTTTELNEALDRRRAARRARPIQTEAARLVWARGKVEQLRRELPNT